MSMPMSHGWDTPRTRRARRIRRGGAAISLLLLLCLLLSACGPGDADQAHANKATLDRELAHARGDLGLPDRMLADVTAQERKAASGDGGLFYNYGDAAARYHQLYTQLVGIEQGAQTSLQQRAQADLQAFAAALDQRRADGFAEVPGYQARLDDARKAYAQATKPGDYAHVSDIASAQAKALDAMKPAFDKLQALQALVKSLQGDGIGTQAAQGFYDQDVQAFRAATSPEDYAALTKAMDVQLTQLTADDASSRPYVAAALLQQFQANIDLLKQYGDTAGAATFQQQHDADASQFAAAGAPGDYDALVKALTARNGATAIPIAKAQATQDFGALQQLVSSASGKTVINPYDHKAYPAAYEYTSRAVGIGDASDNLKAAKTVQQYQAVDFEITSLTACLKAMLANMDDATPHDQPHQTDLQVLQFYKVTSGRAVVISLREQTARFYQDGQLVNWSYVTTGRPELPSVPGWHVAEARLSPTTFTSPDPVGSANYYQPTHINYAIAYNAGGYFLHDAWWRHQFGPNTNLPHRDPAAFNGGSHGCVNFPEANMKWIYNWTLKGTPIILY